MFRGIISIKLLNNRIKYTAGNKQNNNTKIIKLIVFQFFMLLFILVCIIAMVVTAILAAVIFNDVANERSRAAILFALLNALQ